MSFHQGDIIWIDTDPSLGHEQKGRRPALIVSNHLLNQTGLQWLCPITTTERDFPTYFPLDDRTATFGKIMIDQLSSFDISCRNPEFIETCPSDILEAILADISEIVRLDTEAD